MSKLKILPVGFFGAFSTTVAGENTLDRASFPMPYPSVVYYFSGKP